MIHNDAITITTPEEADTILTTRVYDVRDLHERVGSERLTELVQKTVSPDSWGPLGGPGSIGVLDYGGIRALVVNQTMEVHDELSELLPALRRLRQSDLAVQEVVIAFEPEKVAQFRRRMARAVAPDPDRAELARNMNQIAVRIYSQLARKNDGNLVFSPYSMSMACGMLYRGARGQTAIEISKAMKWTLPHEKLQSAFQSLGDARTASTSTSPCTFEVVSRLWGQGGIKFKDEFTDPTLETNESALGQVDFANLEGASARINRWTQSHTSSYMNVINPDDLKDAKVRFALTDVVNCRHVWDGFFEVSSRDAPFLVDGKMVDVPSINFWDEDCRYANIDGLQVVEKKSIHGELTTLVVLLPKNENGSLADLEATLDLKSMDAWNKALKPRELRIQLPKFKCSSSIDLIDVLTELGIRQAFNSQEADFTGVSETKPLHIALAQHKTKIEFGEHARVAGAFWPGSLFAFGGSNMKPLDVRIDRPFIFYLVEKRTGCILIMGRLVDPRVKRFGEF